MNIKGIDLDIKKIYLKAIQHSISISWMGITDKNSQGDINKKEIPKIYIENLHYPDI